MLHDVILVLDCIRYYIFDPALRVHSHAHTIPTAKIQRIFEITKNKNKIIQNYQRKGLLLVYRGIKGRRLFKWANRRGKFFDVSWFFLILTFFGTCARWNRIELTLNIFWTCAKWNRFDFTLYTLRFKKSRQGVCCMCGKIAKRCNIFGGWEWAATKTKCLKWDTLLWWVNVEKARLAIAINRAMAIRLLRSRYRIFSTTLCSRFHAFLSRSHSLWYV